jgi:hypothetical protein
MTENDIDRLIAEARKIADGMAEGGWNANAETIRSLCRSRAGARETNRRLASDNRVLRAEIEALKAMAARAGVSL